MQFICVCNDSRMSGGAIAAIGFKGNCGFAEAAGGASAGALRAFAAFAIVPRAAM